MHRRRFHARRILPYSVVRLRSSQKESVFLRRVLIELLSTHSVLSSAVELSSRRQFERALLLLRIAHSSIENSLICLQKFCIVFIGYDASREHAILSLEYH